MHARIEEQLILHEGLRERAYIDTLGNWTVGVGYNLSARGIAPLRRLLGRAFPATFSRVVLSRDEALTVLLADIKRVETSVRKAWPYYDKLSPIRQRVALDMAFNLGHRAAGFKRAIAAAEREDWPGVVSELYKSRWAYQVGDGPGGRFDRADRLARMVLTNQDYVA